MSVVHDLHAVQPGRHALEREAAVVTGNRGEAAVEDHDGGRGERRPRGGVDDLTVETAGARRLLCVRRGDPGEERGDGADTPEHRSDAPTLIAFV